MSQNAYPAPGKFQPSPEMPSGLRSQVWQIALGRGETKGMRGERQREVWATVFRERQEGQRDSTFPSCQGRPGVLAFKEGRLCMHTQLRTVLVQSDLCSHTPGTAL